MGLSMSWIAANGMALPDLLDALGLGETGERVRGDPVPVPAEVIAFELEGWRFVVSGDCRFASRDRVVAASQGGEAVGAYLEEHVMVSGAFGATNGALVWSAQHDCEYGLEHLDVWGDPPPQLDGLYKDLLQQLREEGGADYVFDAPVDLAASLCGFNPNTFDRELDLVGLKAVKPKDLEDQPLANPGRGPERRPKKPSFLARLLGWA